MITIKTFLLRKIPHSPAKYYNFNNENEERNLVYFIEMNKQYKDELILHGRAYDPFHVDGAFFIKSDDEVIIGFRQFDSINVFCDVFTTILKFYLKMILRVKDIFRNNR